MVDRRSFEDTCIVSCGMLRPEMEHLAKEGFLDPYKLFYTTPGLHTLPEKLEGQLVGRIKRARELCGPRKIIVLYGKKCYLNPREPYKSVDVIISSQGGGIVRVQGAPLGSFGEGLRGGEMRALAYDYSTLFEKCAWPLRGYEGLRERLAVLHPRENDDHLSPLVEVHIPPERDRLSGAMGTEDPQLEDLGGFVREAFIRAERPRDT
ncbi:MAG: hypothetical protein DRP99_03815 [Candidatus Latescibacterota bacterium]|nr:MAG: hypothetical protein DRP99_03815 [Candidatus Latescibacterota bacterium]